MLYLGARSLNHQIKLLLKLEWKNCICSIYS